MKKLIAFLLVLCTVFGLAACGQKPADTNGTTEPTVTTDPTAKTEPTDPTEGNKKVMTHAEYVAAAMDANVVVETYVQAKQGWWEDKGQGKLTVYCQSKDGAYFAYEMKCTKEEADKLVPGTKIRITGVKGEWSGEVEIMDGTFEILTGDTYIAEALDATALLGTDDLIKHQNEKVIFKGLTVEKVAYQNGAPGKDIYVTLGLGGKSYSFCVESYLTGPDTDVYKAAGALKAGAVVDVEGFLYWYEGANPHITAVTVVKAPAMTHAEYVDAAMDSEVVVDTYVQAKQGWWEDKGQGKLTVYCQSKDGAYFAYEMKCTKEEADKLVPGTKIRITGVKGEWSGEVEIMDGTFEILTGDTYIAEALDATALLGTDDLIKHQNEKVIFKGLTVEKVAYQNGAPGKDIYVTLGLGGKSYSFCVESYLTGPDTDVYKAAGALKAGDIVDVEGFLYWYEGANPHITNITKQ